MIPQHFPFATLVVCVLVTLSDALTTTTTEVPTSTTTETPTTTTTQITCHFCNATDGTCTSNDTQWTTCESSNGVCWTLYDSSSSLVTRTCTEPSYGSSTCSSAYPSGVYSGNVCGFCCSTWGCNNQTTLASHCTTIMNSGAQDLAPYSVLAALMTSLITATMSSVQY